MYRIRDRISQGQPVLLHEVEKLASAQKISRARQLVKKTFGRKINRALMTSYDEIDMTEVGVTTEIFGTQGFSVDHPLRYGFTKMR